MTWIKICGITNLEDALVAAEAGADALGFVFYEKSERKIVADSARKILAKIPLHIEKVGVFVNTLFKEMFETAEAAGLSAIQIYGKEGEVSRDYMAICESTPRPKLIYAMDGNGFADSGGVHQKSYMWLISQPFAEGVFAFLVDCASGEKPGGSGNRFDWTRARGAIKTMNAIRPTIVAGGLRAENVTEAMSILHPWGVDVSSGVEARPGKKDPEKVRAFIKAVRDYDAANSRN
jgi:phosphoribosylanthranilate isomerase